MKTILTLLCAWMFTTTAFAVEPVVFNARTAHSSKWSDAETWEGGRKPQAGDFVQVRAGHVVTYDVDSGDALRMVHVAGTLTFSREKSTLLDVGLIKIEPGETTTEDGFDCHDAPHASPAGAAPAVLEIGTLSSPIPAGVKATIRLRHFAGTNSETLRAIIVCGGRWDVHGAPMNRTWLKLAALAVVGDARVTLEQPVSDWHVGDRVIITTSESQGPESGATFQKRPFGRQKPVGTEERVITAIDGAVLTLDCHLNEGPVVEIDLSGTKVTDDDLRLLSNLAELRTLNLHRTGISDAGVEHLKGLKHLTTLTIGDDKQRCAEAALEAILNGRPVAVPTTPHLGCPIVRKQPM